jgi:hypothetical protein
VCMSLMKAVEWEMVRKVPCSPALLGNQVLRGMVDGVIGRDEGSPTYKPHQ